MHKHERLMKVGLLWIEDGLLLLCEPHAYRQLILPGGRIEEGESDLECLLREIREELGPDVELDRSSLTRFGQFTREAANRPQATVTIEAYLGRLSGEPVASDEIRELHWVNPAWEGVPFSPIVAKDIIPALVKEGLLK